MISSNLIGFPLLQFVGSRWLRYRNLTGSINHGKVDARAFREAIDVVRRGRRTVDPSYRDRTSPGEGVRISREYLFLLACYDFRASDIYYIRHSAFHAKIAFLPRVQYDNSSSLKQRYTRCALSLANARSNLRMYHPFARLCIRNEFSWIICRGHP